MGVQLASATVLQGGQGRVHGSPEPTEKSTLQRKPFQFVLLRKRDALCKFEGISGENRFELSPVMVTNAIVKKKLWGCTLYTAFSNVLQIPVGRFLF